MKKNKIIFIIAVIIVIAAGVCLLLLKNFGIIFIKQEPTAQITPPPAAYFDTAAYKSKLDNMEADTFLQAEVAIAEMLDYQGVLPDDAIAAYLYFLDAHLEAWYVKDLTPWYERFGGDLYDWQFAHYCDAIATGFNEKNFVYARPGYYKFSINYTTIYNALNGKISAAASSFFQLSAEYHMEALQGDGALGVSWDTLAEIMIDWSVFKKTYPGFPLMEFVNRQLVVGMYCYTVGLPNSMPYQGEQPNVYRLKDEVRDNYEKFISGPQNKDCVYYDDIVNLYDVWKANDFIYCDDVQAFLDEIEAKISLENSWF